jgi:hypothetical protein
MKVEGEFTLILDRSFDLFDPFYNNASSIDVECAIGVART